MGRTRRAPSSSLPSYQFLPKFVSLQVLTLLFSLSFPISCSGGSVTASSLERQSHHQLSSSQLITGRPLTSSTNSFNQGHYTTSKSIATESSPKIRILQYRIKSYDPHIITEELRCIGTECDELIEPQTKFRLGSGENATNEWSVPPNVTQIVIECQSKSGLVEWDYDGKGDVSDIDIETSRYAGDFWTKSTYSYVSTLRMKHVTDKLTGKYTCRNVEKSSISNSFYMFVPQENLNIYDEGESVDITPPSYATEVIIPCRLPSRKTTIYLMKRRANGSYRQVPLENGVTFDPYVGFRLPGTRDAFGSYACRIDKKRRKQRDISLAMTPPPPPPETTSPPVPKFTNVPVSGMDDGFSYAPNMNTSQSPMPSAVRQPGSNGIKLKRRRKRPLLPWRTSAPPHIRRNGGEGNIQMRHGGAGGRPPPRRGVYFHMRRPPPPPPLMHQTNPLVQGQFANPPPPGPVFSHGVSYNRLPSFNPFLSHPPQGMPKPVKVLPTYSNTGVEGGENQNGLVLNPVASFSSEDPATSHENSNKKISSDSIDDIMSSRVDVNVGPQSNNNGNNGNHNGHRLTPAQPPKRGNLFPQGLLPPTVNVVQTMQCMLKKVLLGFETPCNGIITPTVEVDNGNKDKVTILEANILPPPENKFFPKNSVIYTTVPFFVKWQTRFTDYADWAEVNHTLKEGTFKRHKAGQFEDGVNSLEVFNLVEGDSGEITVSYMGEQKDILTHTWKYFIINNTAYNAKGLKQIKEGTSKNYVVFKCKTSSTNIPKMTLTLLNDGCPLGSKDSEYKAIVEAYGDYSVEECGTGCALLRTQAYSGLVQCIGDGVDEKIRFPSDLYCTGRPYFIERGKTSNITFEEKSPTLIVPCTINNPNADIYLYRDFLNGTVEEITDVIYDLKSGFRLSGKHLREPYGSYYCTSTTDLNDDTDIVTYNVVRAPDYVFHPSTKRIYGTPPFKFMWESKEKLELKNSSAGSFFSGVFRNPDHDRINAGTFEISPLNAPPGASGEVTVVKSSDGEVVHTWFYKHSKKPGLWLDKEKNVFKCQSTSDFRPKLYAVECSIPNVCKLKKRFTNEDENIGRDNSNCGMGCSQLKIWGNKPTGFVRCTGDGVDETSQYFLSQNSTILTDKDDLVNFKTPVITNLVRKLRVGEMTSFSCRASKYFYSKGFQWAVETRDGSKTFMDLKIHEDDSFLNEIKSEINLRIIDANWKAVWCYAPLIESVHWGNVSQPIYIRT